MAILEICVYLNYLISIIQNFSSLFNFLIFTFSINHKLFITYFQYLKIILMLGNIYFTLFNLHHVLIYTFFGSISIAPTRDCTHTGLHPHGIAPTFLKLDSWSPGAGFIPNISSKGINWIKKRKIMRKKLIFMHTKRFNIFF